MVRVLVVVLLVLAEAAGVTGGVRGQATPLANAAPVTEKIAAVAVDQLAPGRALLAIARVIVPAGVAIVDAGTPGPRLIAVSSGELTIIPGAAADVTRSVDRAGTPAVAESSSRTGVATVLRAGDRLAQASGATVEIRNGTDRTAVYLDAAIVPGREDARAYTHEDGWSFEPITFGAVDLAGGPARVSLERWSFPADAGRVEIEGPAMVARVDARSVTVSSPGGGVMVAEPARLAPASVGRPMVDLPAGLAFELEAGGGLLVPEGVPVTIEGRAGTEMLVLSVVRADRS